MEHRGQEKDMGMPNSLGYNPSHVNQQESSSSSAAAKVPSTAPIVSSILHSKPNEQTSHGNTIFSPTQTLDQNNLITQNSDPDPHTTSQLRQQLTTSVSDRNNSSVRYRECLKNHAATMGGHVLDGCGEFMPSGEEGTRDYLICAACDCHRNFHRKETEDEPQTAGMHRNNSTNNHHHFQPRPSLPAVPPQHHQNKYSHHNYSRGPMPPVMMNFGGNTGVPAESSSEDLNMFHSNVGGQGVMQHPNFSKKRFRTKFTQQQKDRMQEFAEKLGWRIQKQDEQEVQQFCNEVGVKRQVFKVFMHNSKQAVKRKQT